MDGIAFDALGVELADRAGSSLGRIGCAHQLPQPGYGVFSFENHHQGGSTTHERSEAFEKRFRPMDGVESLRFPPGEGCHTGGGDTKAVGLKHLYYVAHMSSPNGIRLDDRKRPLQSSLH